ncbi:Rho-binding antiterminator [Paraglaciecola chathamensis]|jgi:Rho-binding antiterminator|uniref:Transcriptional antiterminator n=2 Tax=Paraglaciecola chathamensis TaxID=368405 RepID=A0ABQ0I4R0_9ALTE|nr:MULTISPECIES: Rho-binding antiterminator [Paraglaciecola]GAC04328.1 transcriptional antiterminator [Paraglaciecola agarilytica NO2]GAC08052.1 transcriptional antiterminator [Paraglaciecola chathamensis S18K6]
MKCAEQDYIEIACLYKMPIALTLDNSNKVEGVAKDTVYNEHKEECIVLDTADGELSITLNLIHSMQALKANPHFTLVKFTK